MGLEVKGGLVRVPGEKRLRSRPFDPLRLHISVLFQAREGYSTYSTYSCDTISLHLLAPNSVCAESLLYTRPKDSDPSRLESQTADCPQWGGG